LERCLTIDAEAALQENRMSPLEPPIGCGFIVVITAAVLGGLLTFDRAQAQDKPYTVKDGKVDKTTFNGWRRYTESCLRCHGPDGAGSSYGPDLVESLKKLSEDEFKDVVVNGRQNVSTSAQSVMPPFGTVEDVMLYIDDIYAYLKARSDGVLDRGRPERFDR
jgi:methanol metabolism-related c-type cytochrome